MELAALEYKKVMSPSFLGCYWSDPFQTCKLQRHAQNLGLDQISARSDYLLWSKLPLSV